MIFDTSILSPSNFTVMLGVFVAMYGIVQYLTGQRVLSWRVHSTGRPIYYAGWILALLVAGASIFFIRDSNLAIGLLGATLIAVLIGRLDEDSAIPPARQFFWQALIACWAVYFGWSIPYVSNPFGSGVILVTYGGVAAFIWLMICMNAINFLDGTDGLATLVGIISFIAMAGISLLPATQDARTLMLSCIALGGLVAFFLWNAPSARVYLGTSGSWFLGMFLGMTAIIGGGKIATALIVLALPVLDALFVVVYRMIKKKYPWKGDTVSHIHHRLHAMGASSWGILLVVGGLTALLGIIAVVAPTHWKIFALTLFAIVFFASRAHTMRKLV